MNGRAPAAHELDFLVGSLLHTLARFERPLEKLGEGDGSACCAKASLSQPRRGIPYWFSCGVNGTLLMTNVSLLRDQPGQ